jgi:endonuclease/exonuclease/phosphatase family metal-dependent hydrolase
MSTTLSSTPVPATTRAPRRFAGRLCAAGLVAVCVWHASLRTPCGPAEGTALSSPGFVRPPVGETLRIASFNIHGGRGTDGVRDLGRIANSLRDMDVVGLQEVHGAYFMPRPDGAETLGQSLKLGWLFAPSVRQWHHYDYGNGLLSRAPVNRWQRVPLARTTGNSYHNFLEADIEHRGQTIHLLVTHVHRRDDRERQAQLRTVIERFQSLPEPAILMGDLNTPAADPQLAALLAQPGVQDALAGRITPEPARIDWILTRGLRIRDAGMEVTVASDHPLVWAEIEIEPTAAAK